MNTLWYWICYFFTFYALFYSVAFSYFVIFDRDRLLANSSETEIIIALILNFITAYFLIPHDGLHGQYLRSINENEDKRED